ncbi:hypothetical protein [Xanthomonas euvesicatoria]|uniref:hypothetical protein n=1 Tax=Xanthomonas euvesicatoria TaxID=456327 RepID=UPI000F8E8D83|nr:hypothetical protein [Xanthomonas euvesicatoria]
MDEVRISDIQHSFNRIESPINLMARRIESGINSTSPCKRCSRLIAIIRLGGLAALNQLYRYSNPVFGGARLGARWSLPGNQGEFK